MAVILPPLFLTFPRSSGSRILFRDSFDIVQSFFVPVWDRFLHPHTPTSITDGSKCICPAFKSTYILHSHVRMVTAVKQMGCGWKDVLPQRNCIWGIYLLHMGDFGKVYALSVKQSTCFMCGVQKIVLCEC